MNLFLFFVHLYGVNIYSNFGLLNVLYCSHNFFPSKLCITTKFFSIWSDTLGNPSVTQYLSSRPLTHPAPSGGGGVHCSLLQLRLVVFEPLAYLTLEISVLCSPGEFHSVLISCIGLPVSWVP